MVKNIFIVEDEGILVLVNTMLIHELGHKVVGKSNNGLDAIQLIKKLKPDIILMDIKIKGDLDGIDTMKEIEKFANTAVIYITGNSDAETLARAKGTNMRSFLIKPINIEMLREALDN
ncbi:MAG: response regulator [Bacteroidetes bacterium]|nr:response regulator [Bacteroidota bacterium]